MKYLAAPVVLASMVAGLALAQPETKPAPKPKDAPKTAEPAKDKAAAYPLTTCPISGGKLGSMGEPVVKVYEGREVKFCCASCPPTFEKDVAKSLAKLDESIIKDQTPFYPLDTSVVTGKKLPAKPVDWVYENRLVRLGDEAEKAEFKKDAAKHLAALDKAAVEKQTKDYPLQTCAVSKEKLGSMGKPVDMIVAGRLVRLCCNDCVKSVGKDPAKYIAMVDDARKSGGAKPDKADPKKDAPVKK